MALGGDLFSMGILSKIGGFIKLTGCIGIFGSPGIRASVSFAIRFIIISVMFRIILNIVLTLVLGVGFGNEEFLEAVMLVP